MDTRTISQFAGRYWRSCSAVGCGCLTMIGAVFAVVAVCGVLFLGGSWFRSAMPEPPAVVNYAAPATVNNNAGFIERSSASQPTSGQALTYMPYQSSSPTWGNSLASKSRYLAWANLTGTRRTPYSRGQVLSFSDGRMMTVVTADFDYTLLKDAQGIEWACPPIVDDASALAGCQVWQRGRW